MQGIVYSVDIALCIDATASMGSVIERVKRSATEFHQDLMNSLAKEQKEIDILRVRVIEFRDFYCDGGSALRTSDFFTLPAQNDEFAAFVGGISASGGGDAPESGLEAVALAIKSDWTEAEGRRRHIVVVWTDTSPHPLEMNAGSKPENYPQGMPADFDELTDWWDGQTGMNNRAKRMVIFAPDAYAWSDMGNHWDNSLHYPSNAGEGLSDVDYSVIVDTVAGSV